LDGGSPVATGLERIVSLVLTPDRGGTLMSEHRVGTQEDKDYRFEAEGGTQTLAELFDGRSRLLVYDEYELS
jgi:Bacterial protein of unknown function (DUF899)